MKYKKISKFPIIPIIIVLIVIIIILFVYKFKEGYKKTHEGRDGTIIHPKNTKLKCKKNSDCKGWNQNYDSNNNALMYKRQRDKNKDGIRKKPTCCASNVCVEFDPENRFGGNSPQLLGCLPPRE